MPQVTYFLMYFRAKCREILMSGSREIRVENVSPRSANFHSIATFMTYYACAAFNWVLLVTETKAENCRVLCIVTFL